MELTQFNLEFMIFLFFIYQILFKINFMDLILILILIIKNIHFNQN